ncbi:hypothetical protein PT974_00782 [Cladobotryum mycophilum]|uniref:Uncharacterized protein n=1 Tax=Cladobotryum mycophilum TaxID=491253 RepID=A0ABR0T211_9HYPO
MDRSLAEAGREILKLFKDVAKVNGIPIADDNRRQSLQKNEAEFASQNGRFRLWAATTGLFVLGDQSLDYRSMTKKATFRPPMILGGRSRVERFLDGLNESIDNLYILARWADNLVNEFPSTAGTSVQAVMAKDEQLPKSPSTHNKIGNSEARQQTFPSHPAPHGCDKMQTDCEDSKEDQKLTTMKNLILKCNKKLEPFLVERLACANASRRKRFGNRSRQHNLAARYGVMGKWVRLLPAKNHLAPITIPTCDKDDSGASRHAVVEVNSPLLNYHTLRRCLSAHTASPLVQVPPCRSRHGGETVTASRSVHLDHKQRSHRGAMP